jgi:hypothetical protein
MVEKDLYLGGNLEDEEEYEYEDLDYSEYIQAATNALSSVESLTPLTKEDSKKIKRIKRKSIAIIDYSINELYSSLFGEEDKEEDNDD